MTKKFIVSWDCYGLEACVDVTEDMERAEQFEKESIFERLKNPDKEPENEATRKICRMIQMMSLRARFNPQRNYEIYWLTATDEITDKDVVNWFDDSPQAAADRVREIGTKLLSNRDPDPGRRVIK